MEDRLPKGTLGGQAVIEGVMMKGKDGYSVAIRKPDKKIEVKLEKSKSFGEKHAWARVPFVRGVVNFTESLVVGMKTLSYSSSFYEEEEEETKADKLIKEVFKEKAESVIVGLTLCLSVLLAIGLFMMLPAAIGEFIGKWVDSRILLSLIEGIIRLVIFIVYVVLISQMEDIRRVFMYHGAEHKTINCYEAGDELTPENVAKHSRYHKRCGTSFLFIVMVVSIVIFMFITADQMWLRFLLRMILIPVVAGISYEFIRLAGRTDNVVMNILSKPGMWIQKLTTKEPEEEMIQVAIISVEAVLYGKQYVDAVNEAQGLGKKKTENKSAKSNKTTSVKNVTNNVEEDSLSQETNLDDVVYEEVYEEIYEEVIYEEEVTEEIEEEIEEAIEMISDTEESTEVEAKTEVSKVDEVSVAKVEDTKNVVESDTIDKKQKKTKKSDDMVKKQDKVHTSDKTENKKKTSKTVVAEEKKSSVLSESKDDVIEVVEEFVEVSTDEE